MNAASFATGAFECLVNGAMVPSAQRAQALNPATAKEIVDFGVADRALLEAAVSAANAAQLRWAQTALEERSALLSSLADLLARHEGNLARLLTLEQGKPLPEAAAEIQGSAGVFRHYAALGLSRRYGLFVEHGNAFTRHYTPLGVVAGIVPWNFPLLIAALKIAPALLTGNAILMKPAPTTPLTTLEFGRLCARTVPPGLLQILGDDGTAGPLLVDHPGIRKISLTGSTATGQAVMARSAAGLKRLTLELGGNDPALVLADADPGAVAEAIYAAAFTNAGQICGAIKRVYAHSAIYAPLCQELASRVSAAVCGDGFDPNVTIGPLQNQTQFVKASTLLQGATARGTVIAQSKSPRSSGYFIPATLVTDLSDEDPLVTGEQFAPILPVLKFSTDVEGLQRANAGPYGLTASVWSSDQSRAVQIATSLNAGLVCINKHNDSPLELALSFSQYSGVGWMYGDEGLKEYLQSHVIRW